ncbi:hypothetical protein SAMN05444921_11961 [Streptomyces wuyuanensis]|uniref:Uncharacterized protein n=1 Tax=Streptomyces wuyuanensis TaxID=1196353 RepID=A0A1G9YPK9_9ACTN|nr:hypothetical protein SAMN05444921_11961 [Streptomyces wuyuanensis]
MEGVTATRGVPGGLPARPRPDGEETLRPPGGGTLRVYEHLLLSWTGTFWRRS